MKNRFLYFFILGLILLCSYLSPIAITLILVGCLISSFASATWAIKAISLSWLITSLNPGIFDSLQIDVLLKQGVYFVALSGVVLRCFQNGHRGLIRKDIITLLLFTLYVFISSIFVSYYPEVSILKVILFTVGLLSVILCYRELNNEKWQDIEEWFLALFLVITVVSIPFIFTSYGYTRNGRGFQGILNHPQLFGTFYAVVTAYIAGRMFQFKNFKWEYLFLTVIAIAYIFLSEARTGLLGLSLGFGLAFLFTFRTSVRSVLLNKKVLIPAFVIVILAVPFYGQITSGITNFLLKWGNYEQIEVALEQSRGKYFYSSLQGFLENPIWGNGFGIASNPLLMNVEYDPIFDIPISASVEKGVAPMAVLEENGIIGSLILVLFIYFLSKKIFKQNLFYLVWPLLVIFAINLGEATIFSFNAHAGLYWLILMHHIRKNNYNV